MQVGRMMRDVARRFGRPPSTTPDSEGAGRLALRIDERLKMRAAIYALRAGLTMSQLVERALGVYMTRTPEEHERARALVRRAKVGPDPKKPEPGLPGVEPEPAKRPPTAPGLPGIEPAP